MNRFISNSAKPNLSVANVLVTDCWTRKALSAVRSLGMEGLTVHATTHKILSAPIYSRYVTRHFLLPNPAVKTEQYAAQLMQLLKKEKYDCLIPLEESTMQVIYAHLEEIKLLTHVLLPDEKSFSTASDKWETIQLALELGIPVPQTFYPHLNHEVTEAAEAMGFPLVIKPVNSSGSRGIRIPKNKEELKRMYLPVKEMYGLPLLQQYIPQKGQGKGVGILAKDGEVLVSFSYKRLREFPVKGGPSTLRESTDDPLLKEYAVRLIRALNWTGTAMIEFKEDLNSGYPVLMEINPRFWGSLHLAKTAGVNFPYLLYCIATGKQVTQPKYKTGIKCRWLLPGDIAHFIANPERMKLSPSFFQFSAPDLFYDDFDPTDIKGNFAVVITAALGIFDADNWKMGLMR